MCTKMIFGNAYFCVSILSAIILFNFVEIHGEKDFNVAVNELYKQCREELTSTNNGSVETQAATLSNRSYSSFSQLRTGFKPQEPVNYVTPRPVLPLTGDLVRVQVESMAKIIPFSEMEQYYCIFTKLGFLTKTGDLIPPTDQSKCNAECQSLVLNCITREEVDDAKNLHEKAYKNVMCVYISNWLLHGFAP